jgi:hypothetical protein
MHSPSLLALRLPTASLTHLSRMKRKKFEPVSFGTERCRFFTSDTDATSDPMSSAVPTTKPLAIPDPTWSVASLQLNESHPPANMEQLKLLAQRAALDMRRLDDATQKQLCQDLGNMLHMILHVQENDSSSSNSEASAPLNPADLYDVPRGVTAAPFRDDDALANEYGNRLQVQEQALSQEVRTSFLEPKMRRVGGHQYYEIITSSSSAKGSSKS